ncbi:MAG TPA: hypothetical protein PL033_11390 [Candidatus Brocadiia bacterium]|nr:hypothetical protein [Candidatus Brocadiia bacterium]
MKPGSPASTPFAAVVIVFCLTFLAFLPAIWFDFTNWDDDVFVQTNPLVVFPGSEWWWRAFTMTPEGYFAPVLWWTWRIVYAIGGMDPAVFHALNIALHAASAVMLMILCRRLGFGVAASVGAALMWAAHPLRVESVVWITELKDCLSGAFCMIGALLYLAGGGLIPVRKGLKYHFSIPAFGAAFLSKPTCLSWFLVMILAEFFLIRFGPPIGMLSQGRESGSQSQASRGLGTEAKAVIFRAAPILVIGAVVMAAQFRAQTDIGAIDEHNVWSVGRNVMIAAYSLSFHAVRLFVPVRLSPLYILPFPESLSNPRYILGLAGAAVYMAAILRLLKRRPWAAFSLIAFLVGMLPTLQIIPTARPMADRYSYLPCIPMTMAVAFLVSSAGHFVGSNSAFKRAFPAAAIFLMVGLLGILTLKLEWIWSSSASLWQWVMKYRPDSQIPTYYYVSSQMAMGNINEAEGYAFFAAYAGKQPKYIQAKITASSLSHGADASAANYRILRLGQKAISETDPAKVLDCAVMFLDGGLPKHAADLSSALTSQKAPREVTEYATLVTVASLIEMAQTDGACGLISDAVAQKPALIMERLERAAFLLENNMPRQALRALLEEPETDSAKADALLVELLRVPPDKLAKEAMNRLPQIEELTPNHKAEIADAVAASVLDRGLDVETALHWARMAVVWRREHIDYDATLAWALHRAGLDAEALPWLTRNAPAVCAKPEYLYRLGAIRAALGMETNSRWFIETAIERAWGEPAWKQEAQRLLDSAPIFNQRN